MLGADSENLVSLYAENGAIANRTIQQVVFCPEQELHIPPTSPLFSDSDEHELHVFWGFETGRFARTPAAGMFCLENILVVPEGIAFLSSGECILESMYPFTAAECWARFPEVAAYGTDRESVRRLATAAEAVPDAVFLREPGETGYFHWINSVLPRLAALERLPHLKCLPLLALLGPRFANESFRYLGFDPANVRTQRNPILVRRLWISTPCVIEGDHFTRASFWTKELRRVFGIDQADPPTRTVYLSRSDSAVRRAATETDIVDICVNMGGEAVVADGMSFGEQVALFKTVKTLISIHGAGLSNMAFMPSGLAVEIVSRSRLWPTYRTLAARSGLGYGAYITSFDKEQSGVYPGNENVVVDIAKLRRFLDGLR